MLCQPIWHLSLAQVFSRTQTYSSSCTGASHLISNGSSATSASKLWACMTLKSSTRSLSRIMSCLLRISGSDTAQTWHRSRKRTKKSCKRRIGHSVPWDRTSLTMQPMTHTFCCMWRLAKSEKLSQESVPIYWLRANSQNGSRCGIVASPKYLTVLNRRTLTQNRAIGSIINDWLISMISQMNTCKLSLCSKNCLPYVKHVLKD